MNHNQLDNFIHEFIVCVYFNRHSILQRPRKKAIYGLEDLVELAIATRENANIKPKPLYILRQQDKLTHVFAIIVKNSKCFQMGDIEKAKLIGAFQTKLKEKIEKELKYNFNESYVKALILVRTLLDNWILELEQVHIQLH